MPKNPLILLSLILIALAGCQMDSTLELPASLTPIPPTSTPTVSSPTAQPTRTPTVAPTSLSATASPDPEICSPLADIPLHQIADTIYNPFSPPEAGSDDPHQGVDLAELDPVSRLALEGGTVQAALGGTVSSAIEDRFPYGNAILVETPLENIPLSWGEALNLPDPSPTLGPHPALTCPEPAPNLALDSSQRSLYLLYAHLKDPPTFTPGVLIACGDSIAAVGQTGNALNPHLHLEARVGPASVRFGSMAHYTSSAKEQEMAAYCLWRVSGLFQLVDPMSLLSVAP